MKKISAVVLTKNSDLSLRQCLKSLDFASEIIIIDDMSQDNTLDIARKYTDKIHSHSLGNDFSKQRNYGLSVAENDWVLFVDSDEVISKKLKKEIERILKSAKGIHNGFYVTRLDVMWGKTLEHGDNKTSILRLGRKAKGKWSGKVHETWEIDGAIGALKNPLFHFPHPTVSEFLKETNFYSGLRAEELFEQKESIGWSSVFAYPAAKFVNLYFLKLGILDGVEGLVSALMMAFYSFQVRSKLWQMYEEKRG